MSVKEERYCVNCKHFMFVGYSLHPVCGRSVEWNDADLVYGERLPVSFRTCSDERSLRDSAFSCCAEGRFFEAGPNEANEYGQKH